MGPQRPWRSTRAPAEPPLRLSRLGTWANLRPPREETLPSSGCAHWLGGPHTCQGGEQKDASPLTSGHAFPPGRTDGPPLGSAPDHSVMEAANPLPCESRHPWPVRARRSWDSVIPCCDSPSFHQHPSTRKPSPTPFLPPFLTRCAAGPTWTTVLEPCPLQGHTFVDPGG